jgi:hypothetical protein
MTNLLVNKYENSLLGNTLLNNTQQLGAVINHTA